MVILRRDDSSIIDNSVFEVACLLPKRLQTRARLTRSFGLKNDAMVNITSSVHVSMVVLFLCVDFFFSVRVCMWKSWTQRRILSSSSSGHHPCAYLLGLHTVLPIRTLDGGRNPKI